MFIAYDFSKQWYRLRKVLDDNATTSTNVKLQHVTNNPDQGMINCTETQRLNWITNCDRFTSQTSRHLKMVE